MAKYADITPFYEWLDWLAKESKSIHPDYNTLMFYEIRDKLGDLPEVVRCKDCKHLACNSAIDRDFRCRNYPYGLRGLLNPIDENPFCSYGERKDV